MNKILNILGFIVGFSGLIIGLVTYCGSQKSKEISFNLYSPSYKIYDNEAVKKASSISLILNDTTKIRQNVYLTTFSIWNSGDLPIIKTEIRKKIEIEFYGVSKILNISVIKEVEKDISKFQLTSINNKNYSLDWNYFDPNDGLKVQIIYIGNENINCKVEGKILETKFKEFIPIQSVAKKVRPFFNYTLPVVIILIIVSIIIMKSAARQQKPWRTSFKIAYFLFWIIQISTVLLVVYNFYQLYFKVQNIPF